MFCSNCYLIFQQPFGACHWDASMLTKNRPTWKAKHNYATIYQDLLTTATKCHCCREVLRELEICYQSTVSADEQLQFRMEWKFDGAFEVLGYGDGRLDIVVVLRNRPKLAKVQLFTPRFRETRKFSNRREVEPDRYHWSHNVTSGSQMNSTGSDYTIRFVRECLEHCKSHHRKCRADWRGPPWYPTRLVEVLEDDGVKVIETSETKPNGPYATLSHCWGAVRHITATTKNIDCLKKQVVLSDLPKTFSDALRFIKGIGISFIWIDSLCIIQDSAKDWEFESRKMLQVYRHAECNLAAAVSKDSHGGLFSERNHAALPSGCFKADNKTPHVPACYVYPRRYFNDAFGEQIGFSHLTSRGWVYQERAASKRIVAFGRDQVFWDCPQRLESDILPGHHLELQPPNAGSHYHLGPVGLAVPKHISPAVPCTVDSLDDGLTAWKWIVRRYSECKFTFTEDKAVAILGVAEMMSNALRAQPEAIDTAYWAGLWRQDMFWQLAWEVAGTRLRKSHHAPSWSWLSIDGPVEWLFEDDLNPKPKNRIVSALATVSVSDEQTTKRKSTFCEVSADLRIWCTLRALHAPEPIASAMAKDGSSWQRADLSKDQDRSMTAAEQSGLQLGTIRLDSNDIDIENVYFLPLTHSRYGRRSYYRQFEVVVGILVQPVENQPGTYRRCGSGMSHRYFSDDYPMELEMDITDPGDDAEGSDDHLEESDDEFAWMGRISHLLGNPPSVVDFAYEKYDEELGYLIRLV